MNSLFGWFDPIKFKLIIYINFWHAQNLYEIVESMHIKQIQFIKYSEIWSLESTAKTVVMEGLWKYVLMTSGMKQYAMQK